MNRVLIRSECYTQDKRTKPEKDFKIWMNRSPSLTYREVENRTVCQKRKADTKITISPFDPDNDNDEKMKSSGAVPLKKNILKMCYSHDQSMMQFLHLQIYIRIAFLYACWTKS